MNRISSIPDNFLSNLPLDSLYLDHNQLTEIPNDIGSVTKLKILKPTFLKKTYWKIPWK